MRKIKALFLGSILLLLLSACSSNSGPEPQSKDLDQREQTASKVQTPLAEGSSGTLAYYAPWGNVVLYYGECGGASGLYALGKAVSGTEQIESLSGEIQIEAVSSE